MKNIKKLLKKEETRINNLVQELIQGEVIKTPEDLQNFILLDLNMYCLIGGKPHYDKGLNIEFVKCNKQRNIITNNMRQTLFLGRVCFSETGEILGDCIKKVPFRSSIVMYLEESLSDEEEFFDSKLKNIEIHFEEDYTYPYSEIKTGILNDSNNSYYISYDDEDINCDEPCAPHHSRLISEVDFNLIG